MDVKEFTKERGIEIQANYLNKWKSILKPEIFEKLYTYVLSTNKEAKTGNDIMRGVSIDSWVHNNLMKEE